MKDVEKQWTKEKGNFTRVKTRKGLKEGRKEKH